MTTTGTAIGHTSRHTEAGLFVIRRPAHTIVKLSGRLDIASTPALRERLNALLHTGMGLLILDLSEVSFCDVAGLAVFIGTQRRATPLGVTLRLAAPRPQIANLLRLTGLDRTLACLPTTALSRPGPTREQAEAERAAEIKSEGVEPRSAIAARQERSNGSSGRPLPPSAAVACL